MLNRILYILILPTFTVACSDNGDSGNSTTPSPEAVYTIRLDFTRLETGNPNPFTVTATITKDGQALTGLGNVLQIALSRDSYDTVSEIGDHRF